MALICDTSGVYSLYDADSSEHSAVSAVCEVENGPLFLPVILLAEIDYLLHSRLGADAALDFIQAIQQEEFTLVPLITEDIIRCRELLTQYRDMQIGLADATVVAAAERLHIDRLLTLDQRRFRAITPRKLDHFRLLPADAT
jgi:predicted nucleic acid-binding protein